MKKRLDTALPLKSNLTLKEQLHFIKKTFYSLEGNDIKKVVFNDKEYVGLLNEDYGFFEEKDFDGDPDIYYKIRESYLVYTAEIFLKLIDFLDSIKFNRNFRLQTEDNNITLIDLMTKKEEVFKDYVFLDQDKKIEFNSKFLYIFKMNKKTLSKKNYIYFYKEYILVDVKRKGKNILFYIKI